MSDTSGRPYNKHKKQAAAWFPEPKRRRPRRYAAGQSARHQQRLSHFAAHAFGEGSLVNTNQQEEEA